MDRRAQIVRSRDGRVLTFAEWGKPDGAPIFYLHGTPSSRLSRGLSETPTPRTGQLLVGLTPQFPSSELYVNKRHCDNNQQWQIQVHSAQQNGEDHSEHSEHAHNPHDSPRRGRHRADWKPAHAADLQVSSRLHGTINILDRANRCAPPKTQEIFLTGRLQLAG